MAEVEEHARMGRPQRHRRVRAVRRQVFCFELYGWHLFVIHGFSETLRGKTSILADSGSDPKWSVK
jgi:hypothetical protein